MTDLYQIYTIRCRNVLSLTVYVAMIVFIKLRMEMGIVSKRQQPDHIAETIQRPPMAHFIFLTR